MNITRSTKPSFALPLVMFIILGLSGCIGPRVDEPLRPPPAPPQPSGVLDVAARLNARYANTVESCSNGGAALECSGVLIRRSTSSNFWVHSAAAAALGSVTFSYLRADATISRADASGFIFMDKQTAQQQGKSWAEPRCIYPFIAGTQNAGRPANGCGFAARAAADQSTCAGLAVPAVTPALWIENFQRFGSNPRNQCSLSTRDASQFMTSLKVRGSLASQASTLLNEMLIPTWDVNTPERLPIEAFFYNAASPGSLITAQMLRHDYRVRTGLSLPIVRLDFAKPTGERFAQRAADQEDGWQVAEQLNARFADKSRQCADGRAPVYCNGVLVRGSDYSTAFHAWNPNPNSNPKDAVSFSYLRADIKTVRTARSQGFVFKESGYIPGAALERIAPLCIYMADANSWKRPTQGGCGPCTDYPLDSSPCASMGINDLPALREHFFRVGGNPAWQRLHHQCSLAIQPASFMLAIEGRRDFIVGTENVSYGYNEIMLTIWPQNVPDRLPLEAFFYSASDGAAALEAAKNIQRDFQRSSSDLIKPVLRLDLNVSSNPFSYRLADQGL